MKRDPAPMKKLLEPYRCMLKKCDGMEMWITDIDLESVDERKESCDATVVIHCTKCHAEYDVYFDGEEGWTVFRYKYPNRRLKC